MKYLSIDEYINSFPVDIQKKLTDLRNFINSITELEEVISYNMPAFKKDKVLVYFAANKNHIGFYPTPSAIDLFKDDLKGFKYSKGAIQIPYNVDLPYDLIRKVVLYREANK